MKTITSFFLLTLFSFSMIAQKNQDKMNSISKAAPSWSQNANIYEVNIRQYTPEGTFNAFAKSLPRLKEMGVDILWLMPVFPIGELNRKGGLGSYYSISDYKSVNPKFGTMADLDAIIAKAHQLGMKVILDWVANHTSFDHVWTKTHPEWYNRDAQGNILVPADNDGKLTDWTDVADLNYNNKEMRQEMINDMLFWVKDHKVDGFRCDVAGFVPLDFWQDAKKQLDKQGQYFMLAEDESPQFHDNAFHMSYAWSIHHKMIDVAKDKAPASAITQLILDDQKKFPKDAYRMLFIDNHDENSWHGTIRSRFGKGFMTFAVLTYTLPGMPLMYSGQEATLNKTLRFFEKDTIDFKNYPMQDFYTKLNALKHDNEALGNGSSGGKFLVINNSKPNDVVTFVRKSGESEIFVATNLSAKSAKVKFSGKNVFTGGTYIDYFTGKKLIFHTSSELALGPWDYKIYIKEN